MKLVISDIDDTLAEPFKPASPSLMALLIFMLEEGLCLFLLTGQGFNNAFERIVKQIPKNLTHRVFLGYCNGAQVCRFEGHQALEVFNAVEDLGLDINVDFVSRALEEVSKTYQLTYVRTRSLNTFIDVALESGIGTSVMLDDRGIQISLDFICALASRESGVFTAIDDVDAIRQGVVGDLNHYFSHNCPYYEAKYGGVSAIDIGLKGVNKGLPLRRLLKKANQFSVSANVIEYSSFEDIEIWGDSFSIDPWGADRSICVHLPYVRALSFRDLVADDLQGLPRLQRWSGASRLSEGLLEYLQVEKKCFYQESLNYGYITP